MASNFLYFVAWYIVLSVLGFITLPITFRLFIHLPDRGYAFAKPLGLLFVSYILWLLASFGILYNDAGGILLSVIIVLSVGIWFQKKVGVREIWNWIKEHKQTVFLIEALFFLLFAGWTIVRMYNPDINGTEKPMEFMFINSILHSPTFPPQDAWLSDYAISYYYFGYVMMAALIRITGTPAPVAFNLGISLLFALVGIASLGVVMNLIALVKGERFRINNANRLLSSFWPGLLGPLMILIVGNWYGALELAHNNGLFANTQIPSIWYDFGQANDISQVKSLRDFVRKPGIRIGKIGLWDWLDLKQLDQNSARSTDEIQLDLPNWFYEARVIHDRNLIGVETEAIDEVPAFSFLLADMHPHVLALPFVITVIALGMEWLLTSKKIPPEIVTQPMRYWFPWDRILLSTILLGGLVFLNTWDFPIYWFFTVFCFTAGLGLIWNMSSFKARWFYPLAFAAIQLFISVLLYWPFLLTFQSQAGGILPNLIYPTRFQQTVVMFGPLLAGILLLFTWLAYRLRARINWKVMVSVSLGILIALVLIMAFLALSSVLKPANGNVFLSAVYPLTQTEALSLFWQRRLVDSGTSIVAALLVGLATAIAISVLGTSKNKSPSELGDSDYQPIAETQILGKSALVMVLGMILTGSLLLLGPEFVYLRDNFGTRMNTIFKFYFQIWVLWGIASCFGIWYIWQFARAWFRRVSSVLWIVCAVLGAFYLFGGLLNKTEFFTHPISLDGMAYYARMYPDDWAAMQWLQENAQDGQVILEGSKGAYWIEGPSSRISMATGLPTVMGWFNHEAQWRGASIQKVSSRMEDIQTIYQSRDWQITQKLLDQYQVKYVIVSPFEGQWYGRISLTKFDQNMVLVFHSGDVRIYSR